MKILLVAINSKYIHTNIAVYALREVARKKGHDVKIFETNQNLSYDNILFDILQEEYDAIGFSTYIFNRSIVEKLCQDVKKVNPTATIFCGGGEVYYHPNGMENVADVVLMGEGELIFENLVEGKYDSLIEKRKKINDILRKQPKELNYGEVGAVYRDIGEIYDVFNVEYQKILENVKENTFLELDFDITASMFENRKMKGLVFFEQCKTFDTVINTEYYDQVGKILYYESSRGCPFSCSYCQSGKKKNYYALPLKKIKSDIDKLCKKNLPLIKFVDRTFNANKDRCIDILEYINELKTKTCFHFEISPDNIDDRFIEVVKKSKKGQFQFEIGIQSFNEETLKEISRFTNIDKLKKNIKKLIKTEKANVHVDLIVGLPKENMESFKNSFNMAYSLGSDQLQVGFLKVLAGTEIANRKEEYEIVSSSFPPYQVLKTKEIETNEIITLMNFENAVEIYHNERKFERSLKALSKHFNTDFDMFLHISKKLERKNQISLQKKVEILYEILSKFENAEYTENIVRYDYLLCCKDKKIKLPLVNSPDEIYYNRHQKDIWSQYFEYNPKTGKKEKVKVTFDYSKKSPVTNMFQSKLEKVLK